MKKQSWFAVVMLPLLAVLALSAPQQEVIVNSVGMTFKLIPAGSFKMGAVGGFSDEVPLHMVTISKPFYIGIHEVTQEQFKQVMGSDPSEFKGAQLPVERISWEMAVEFCKKLSEKEGVVYRLPTEAEWEYAARGGIEGATYVWGDSATPRVGGAAQANVADISALNANPKLKTFANYDDGYAQTSPVGSFVPNGFGLYDMGGNVWEWCADWYGEGYYGDSPDTDPQGPANGEYRVFRGGSWDDGPKIARIGLRGILHGGEPKPTNGFRVVREVR